MAKATVMAIGTAVPPNKFDQSGFADFLFNVTNSNDKVELKSKFERICSKSAIKERYLYLNEEILRANSATFSATGPSLDARQEIVVREVPKLAKEAALKAIAEWGQSKSAITHLVFATRSGVAMPGADFQLLKHLGLRHDLKRVMIYHQGCFAGATALRIAKDLAENNPGARVLVAASEITAIAFRAPSEEYLDGLVWSALIGDGAACLIVGSNPTPAERPLFEIHWAGQSVLPDSENVIYGRLRESGLFIHMLRTVPDIISINIKQVLKEPLDYIKKSDKTDENGLEYSDLFWVVHPGGRAILDRVEAELGLDKDHFRATREVLAEYGNMVSASVLFVLDRMRKRSAELNKETTGDGFKCMMLSFGPGVTVETLLLKSF